MILTHERSHLRRGDLFANAFATALRTLYWFNPLIHYAAARMRHDHELASDADVLRQHPNARRRYADTLLNAQLAVPGLPVGCLWQSSHPLIVESAPPGVFDNAASAAVQSWQFNPAVADGKPLPVQVLVPICFSLTQGEEMDCSAPAGALDGIHTRPSAAAGTARSR